MRGVETDLLYPLTPSFGITDEIELPEEGNMDMAWPVFVP